MPLFDFTLKELRKYKPPLTRKKDFSAFWDSTLKEARREPLRPQREKLSYPARGVKVYKISYSGFRGAKIYGTFIVPDSRGKMPALLWIPGYGWERETTFEYLAWTSQGFAVLGIDVRGQACETADNAEYSMGGVPGMLTKGILDKEEYYYRNVYMDCVKALDFLCQCPEVDTARIGVMGASQGGGLTLATAALDRRPKAACAEVPFLCHFEREIDLSELSEFSRYIGRFPEREKQIMETLSYFDCMNLADRIKCPTKVTAGMVDNVCVPSAVYAMYNRLKCRKEMTDNLFLGHVSSRQNKEEKLKWFIELLCR